MEKVTVILPTYMEGKNLALLLPLLEKMKIVKEIIVVDENSQDMTKLLRKKKWKKVRFIINKKRIGLSGSVWLGMKNSTGEYIIVMDADFQHPPALIYDLVSYLSRCDIVICTRIHYHLSFWRNVLSFLSNICLNLVLAVKRRKFEWIPDLNTGFFGMRKKIVKQVNEKRIVKWGWKILFDILKQIGKCKICFLPFSFGKRKCGKSKFSFHVIVATFLSLLT